jgi:hypothetical protein
MKLLWTEACGILYLFNAESAEALIFTRVKADKYKNAPILIGAFLLSYI